MYRIGNLENTYFASKNRAKSDKIFRHHGLKKRHHGPEFSACLLEKTAHIPQFSSKIMIHSVRILQRKWGVKPVNLRFNVPKPPLTRNCIREDSARPRPLGTRFPGRPAEKQPLSQETLVYVPPSEASLPVGSAGFVETRGAKVPYIFWLRGKSREKNIQFVTLNR